MAHQQDKRRSVTNEVSNADASVHSHGATSSKRSSMAGSEDGGSVQLPIVSNLVRIFSEATTPKPAAATTSQSSKSRSSSIASASKHDELVRIMEQAAHRSQRSSTSSVVQPPAQSYEVPYEEINWDSLVHG